MGHARALLTLSESQQKTLLAETLARKYSVRQIEARVKQIQQSPDQSVPPPPRDINIDALEERLGSYLGYPVAIRDNGKGRGRVVLKYNNLDELDGILAKWGFKPET